MKKVIVGVAFAALLATPAFAADMAVKAPPVAASPVYNWNGFYFGANVGGGWSNGGSEADPLPSPAAFNELPHHFNLKGVGGLGGIQAGYNLAAAPNWLIGVEGDISWAGILASGSDPDCFSQVQGCSPQATTMSRDVRWLTSARGRLGYSQDSWLLYVTGGFAAGGVQWSAASPSSPPGILWSTTYNKTETGYVIGGGIEKALDAYWTLRAEYLFYRLSGSGPVVVNGVPLTPPFQFGFSWANFDVNVVRIGLSRKFN